MAKQPSLRTKPLTELVETTNTSYEPDGAAMYYEPVPEAGHALETCHPGALVARCYGAALLGQNAGTTELPKDDICFTQLTDGCKITKTGETLYTGDILLGNQTHQIVTGTSVADVVAKMYAIITA